MKIIHYIFYFLPYIFVMLIIYIINIKHRKGRINTYAIIVGIVIIIALIAYYLPTKNILKDYTPNYINITIDNNKSFSITEKEKVDKILSILNSHTFIRSATRTIRQQNFVDSQYIMINTTNEKPFRLIQLYVLKDSINNNALEINDQIYNVRDKAGLSNDILNELKEIGVPSNK